jgi:uncharacterized repeat protein (TIGR01451 family)/MYXO-CTERM domain-containing protein
MSARNGFGRAVRRSSRRTAVSFFSLLLLFSLALGQGTGLNALAGGLSGSLQPASGGQTVTDLAKGAKVGGATGAAAPRTTAAADAINVNLDQFANKPGQGWQNGDLNGSNSAYGEGMVVPFRLAIEGVTAGQHTIHLNHDFLSGSSEAYDFLATWNVTENPDKCAQPNSGGASSHCPNALGAADTEPFPGDSFVPAVSPGLTVNGAISFANVSRNLTMYGGTINSIGSITHASGKADMVVTFTTTSNWAFFLWGAHIAQSAYWNEFNGGDANGAATISGAPWHMRTQNLDGSGNKNQDRSIQPSAISVVQPNVEVTKVADDATISAGDTAGFTITVTNGGPGAASDVTLTDPLPSGVAWSFDQVTGGWTCGISSGTLTCGGQGFSLAEGASASVHVYGTTDAADCGTLTNTATVSASNEAADSDTDNSATATITVSCASIGISKTADAGSVSAGTAIGYTITVTNGGAGTAHGVTMTDTLPTDAGLSWSVGTVTGGWSCAIAAGVLTCGGAAFDLAPGASASVHVTSPTTSATCGTVDNTAHVATSNDGSGDASASIEVLCPDIEITKTADDASVDAADQIGFTITVTNNGEGVATDVTVSDTLPTNPGLSWTEDPDLAECSITAGVLTCDFGDLAPGESASVHITSDTDATTCGTVDNTATVTISNGSGDEATDSVVVNCPDLGIDIEKGGPALAHVGDTIVYNFTVQLTTTETLFNVVVSDPNCNEGAPVYVSGDDGDQALETGEVWNYTCTHVVTAGDPDPLPNTATVEGTSDDGRPASDQDSHSVNLIHPDIRIVKTVSPQSGEPGDTVTYTYMVTNTGDTTLFDISVDDDVMGHIGDIDQLAPGHSATLTAEFVLPDQDGDLPLVNIGTATGTDVLEGSVSDDDDAGVTILRAETPPPPPTAFTGSDAERIGLIAAGLLALGLLALALGRRRRGQTV